MWSIRSRRRRLRPKDIICPQHLRRLQLIGVGSLMDLKGRTTLAALGRVRAEMSQCTACTALQLDSMDANR